MAWQQYTFLICYHGKKGASRLRYLAVFFCKSRLKTLLNYVSLPDGKAGSGVMPQA